MGKNDLEKLGFDDWFLNEIGGNPHEGFSPARVIEVNKNRYVVSDGIHEMQAELSGKFLFDALGAADFPTAGDWVMIQAMDDFSLAIVHSLLPRKTILKRKEAGRKIDFQLIASNIDFGLVVQSATKINFNLLDRYFVMLNESGIEPVAVFSKIDLIDEPEFGEIKEKLTKLKNKYMFISNVTDLGIRELSAELLPGKTYCLLGQSGVGKTSLLNRLLGSDLLKVSEVRQKDGRGRHTTVRRQLIRLESGSIFIDTPGMRELGNFDVDHGLEETFDEFTSYAAECRFRDCTHTHEDGCAIIAAVESGDLDENRYLNYLKLKKESEYYEMSYQERRRKDKSLSKIVKNYKKFKKKN